MESRGRDKDDELAAETPEDVAVLYSWANLHGAKYRDFSASRREYRAQLRHRAAEQVRDQALLAQAEAEAAAKAAESAARQAAETARTNPTHMSDSGVQRSLREAEDAARTAAAERVEAARRAEAAAVAEAAARREEREIAEAHASAQRQAARYADSEMRRRLQMSSEGGPQILGQMSDPYVPVSQADIPQSPPPQAPMPTPTQQERALQQPGIHSGLPVAGINHYSSGLQPAENYPITAKSEYMSPASQVAVRRPQGYRPDDASGVRQIYRGPEYGQPAQDGSGSGSAHTPTPVRNQPVPIPVAPMTPVDSQRVAAAAPGNTSQPGQPMLGGKRRTDPQPQPLQTEIRQPRQDAAAVSRVEHASRYGRQSRPMTMPRSHGRIGRKDHFDSGFLAGRRSIVDPLPAAEPGFPGAGSASSPIRPVSPFLADLPAPLSTPRVDAVYKTDSDINLLRGLFRPATAGCAGVVDWIWRPTRPFSRTGYAADPAGPAWLYALLLLHNNRSSRWLRRLHHQVVRSRDAAALA